MSEPRFYVDTFTGYSIPERADGRDSQQRTSFYVYDRLYHHTVVATFENKNLEWKQSLLTLRKRAERECERLNEWWRAELARG